MSRLSRGSAVVRGATHCGVWSTQSSTSQVILPRPGTLRVASVRLVALIGLSYASVNRWENEPARANRITELRVT